MALDTVHNKSGQQYYLNSNGCIFFSVAIQ